MAAQDRTESPPGRHLDIVREGDGDPRHGRYTTYTNHRCRCPECRAAWTEYHRDLRERRARQVT